MTSAPFVMDPPTMPDLVHPFAEFRHSLDSALRTLRALNIPSSRITLKTEGPGPGGLFIAAQDPVPGAPVDPNQTITLTIAGLGFCDYLPMGLRESGDELEPGTRDLLEGVDDPLQKAGNWIREGALLFNLHEEDLEACSRWIRIFGIDPQDWPKEQWTRLALLLPLVQSLAGSDHGLSFGLQLLLGLRVQRITTRPGKRMLRSRQLSRLGERASRLAIDCVSGAYREDVAQLVLTLGPVSLATYLQFQSEHKSAQLRSALGLLMPCFRSYTVQWSVEDAARAPRLGRREANSILGVNSALGIA